MCWLLIVFVKSKWDENFFLLSNEIVDLCFIETIILVRAVSLHKKVRPNYLTSKVFMLSGRTKLMSSVATSFLLLCFCSTSQIIVL